MAPTLIWDLPTRLFHWTLAAGFAAAAAIALGLGEHSPLFPYHAIIGLTLVVMVALRLVWGLVGTRHARFGSLVFGPRELLAYLKGAAVGGGKRYIAHNPASAYAIVAMLALLVALAVTGVMLGKGMEGVKDVHEWCAYAMLAVVGVHILGIIAHTVRHRENITASMIHGRRFASPTDGIASARPIDAALYLAITGAWAFGLVRQYNPSTQTTTLPVLGTALQLGEAEDERKHEGHDARKDHDD
ncbi:MAG: cytochrome b/b6 domain-containing protein [Phycisphaerales bacterium]